MIAKDILLKAVPFRAPDLNCQRDAIECLHWYLNLLGFVLLY